MHKSSDSLSSSPLSIAHSSIAKAAPTTTTVFLARLPERTTEFDRCGFTSFNAVGLTSANPVGDCGIYLLRTCGLRALSSPISGVGLSGLVARTENDSLGWLVLGTESNALGGLEPRTENNAFGGLVPRTPRRKRGVRYGLRRSPGCRERPSHCRLLYQRVLHKTWTPPRPPVQPCPPLPRLVLQRPRRRRRFRTASQLGRADGQRQQLAMHPRCSSLDDPGPIEIPLPPASHMISTVTVQGSWYLPVYVDSASPQGMQRSLD